MFLALANRLQVEVLVLEVRRSLPRAFTLTSLYQLDEDTLMGLVVTPLGKEMNLVLKRGPDA